MNSTGAITINNLTASYNTTLNGYGRGAAINNCNNTDEPNGGICTVASAPVTLTGTNTFNYNWANGLQIDSIGAITISNLNANNNGRANTNGGAGAQLNNCENYGIPQCSTSVVHAVTLTGNNIFDNNYYDGLDITAYGPIVASNITADDNGTSASDVNAIYYTGGSGASWDNCVWSNSTNSCTGSSTVTLTGINQFNGNYSDLISTDPNNLYNFPQGGLTITSGGAITVNNVTANGDLGGDGAYIYNNITATAQAITVNNTLSNTFNGNAVNGLEVDSIGVINVSNITANTNGKDGAYLDNCIQYNSGQCSVAAAQSVTVTNTTLNTFNGNYGNGLDVESYGSITASNLNASGNGTSSTTSGTGVSLNNDYVGYFYKEMALLIPAVQASDIHRHYSDRWLANLDFRIWHANPCVWLERIQTPALTEFEQLVYTLFVPAVILVALLLWHKGRYKEFQYYAFLIGVGYLVSYVGYIFVPARGPRYLLNSLQHIPLQGLWLFRSMQDGLDKLESYHYDCFPSGHTELTLLACGVAG